MGDLRPDDGASPRGFRRALTLRWSSLLRAALTAFVKLALVCVARPVPAGAACIDIGDAKRRDAESSNIVRSDIERFDIDWYDAALCECVCPRMALALSACRS